MVSGRDPTSFFCMWMSNCPIPLVKETRLSPIEWSWFPCWTSCDIPFISGFSILCLPSASTPLSWLWERCKFQNWDVGALPTLFFLLQDGFGYLLQFHMNVGSAFPFQQNEVIGISTGLELKLEIALATTDILTVLNLVTSMDTEGPSISVGLFQFFCSDVL